MHRKTFKWAVAQSLEVRWWKNYLNNKDTSAYLAYKKSYWERTLAQINGWQLTPGTAILDAGCGPAGIFMNMPPSVSVDAIDPLLEQYVQLPHFKKSMYTHVQFHVQALEDFNAEKQYDIVFCMNAINHVSDITLCYDKLVGLLKSGGQLIITIDAHNHPFFRSLCRLTGFDALHPHQYNLEEYCKMLTDRKLTIAQIVKLKKEFFFDHYLLVAHKL